MTHERLSMQMRPNHAIDSSWLGVTTVVTTTEGAVLYSMGFQMDYWIEIMAGW
jgi:hypothetical protein